MNMKSLSHAAFFSSLSPSFLAILLFNTWIREILMFPQNEISLATGRLVSFIVKHDEYKTVEYSSVR